MRQASLPEMCPERFCRMSRSSSGGRLGRVEVKREVREGGRSSREGSKGERGDQTQKQPWKEQVRRRVLYLGTCPQCCTQSAVFQVKSWFLHSFMCSCLSSLLQQACMEHVYRASLLGSAHGPAIGSSPGHCLLSLYGHSRHQGLIRDPKGPVC